MKSKTKNTPQPDSVKSAQSESRLKSLCEERIPLQFSRCLEGHPELDYLIALCTDFVLEAQKEMNIDLNRVEAALQLILQSYRLEAHMYAKESGTLNFQLGAEHRKFDVYTSRRRSYKVWEMGFYFGLICRSRMFMSDFRMLPYTRQFLQNNIFDEFRVIYYHFLRQLETPQMEIFLNRSAQVLTKIPMNYATHYHSYFPLWKPVMEGDESKFNLRLKEIISFRKEFGQHSSIETLVPMIAILSYAHDMGMHFEIPEGLSEDLITGHFIVDINDKLETSFSAEH